MAPSKSRGKYDALSLLHLRCVYLTVRWEIELKRQRSLLVQNHHWISFDPFLPLTSSQLRGLEWRALKWEGLATWTRFHSASLGQRRWRAWRRQTSASGCFLAIVKSCLRSCKTGSSKALWRSMMSTCLSQETSRPSKMTRSAQYGCIGHHVPPRFCTAVQMLALRSRLVDQPLSTVPGVAVEAAEERSSALMFSDLWAFDWKLKSKIKIWIQTPKI